jgi:hypothetical protein
LMASAVLMRGRIGEPSRRRERRAHVNGRGTSVSRRHRAPLYPAPVVRCRHRNGLAVGPSPVMTASVSALVSRRPSRPRQCLSVSKSEPPSTSARTWRPGCGRTTIPARNQLFVAHCRPSWLWSAPVRHRRHPPLRRHRRPSSADVVAATTWGGGREWRRGLGRR